MKAVITQRVTRQIGDSEFDTSTDVLILDANESISKIREHFDNKHFPDYCWGHLELQFLD